MERVVGIGGGGREEEKDDKNNWRGMGDRDRQGKGYVIIYM